MICGDSRIRYYANAVVRICIKNLNPYASRTYTRHATHPSCARAHARTHTHVHFVRQPNTNCLQLFYTAHGRACSRPDKTIPFTRSVIIDKDVRERGWRGRKIFKHKYYTFGRTLRASSSKQRNLSKTVGTIIFVNSTLYGVRVYGRNRTTRNY